MPQFSNQEFQSHDHKSEFDPQDINTNKVIAAISYMGILFFLPLLCCPNSKFGKFHANQSLVLFILEVILSAVAAFARAIPIFGWLIALPLQLLGVAIFVIAILWLVFTLNGDAREIPVLGRIHLIS